MQENLKLTLWFEILVVINFLFLVDNKMFCKRLQWKHLETHKNPQWREGKPWSLCGADGSCEGDCKPRHCGRLLTPGRHWPAIQAPTDSGFSPSVLEILSKHERFKMFAVSHSLAWEGFWAQCLLCSSKANAWLHLLFLHIHSWKIYLEGKI